MFITLTKKIVQVPGHDKINLNVNHITHVQTVKSDNYGVCTSVAYISDYRCIHVAETQEEVMAMINAALAREYNTARANTGNRLSDIFKKESA